MIGIIDHIWAYTIWLECASEIKNVNLEELCHCNYMDLVSAVAVLTFCGK